MIVRSLLITLKFSLLCILIASSSAYQIHRDAHETVRALKPRNIFAAAIITAGFVLDVGSRQPIRANAATFQAADRMETVQSQQSPGWEMARQKRTAAMKAMQVKGIIKIDTDDSGNQFLKLPWVPDQRLPYKSLSMTQRLQGEICAGAIGELSKDVLLHAVDTAKTRKQVAKKGGELSLLPSQNSSGLSIPHILGSFKELYSGFPIVLATSIPQGGVFFLVKKGIIELLNKFAPSTPSIISSTVPIGFGVMAYWLFRTPAEVIKTQVQTFQSPNCKAAWQSAKDNNANGVFGLWKHYTVMLSLDIPFQILNFVLLGVVSDAVLSAGYETSVFTRLFCGVTCGMITAAVTCPIDVCKTRIITRSKAVGGQVLITATIEALQGADVLSSVEENASKSEALQRNEVYSIDDGSWSKEQGTVRLALEQEIAGVFGVSERQTVSSGSVLVAVGQQDRVMRKAEVTEDSTAGLDRTVQSDSVSAVETSRHLDLLPPEPAEFNFVAGNSVIDEMFKIIKEEGVGTLFLGIKQRLVYVGLANGIRLAAYGTSRMDLMMKSLDVL